MLYQKLAIGCRRNWAGHRSAGLLMRGYGGSAMSLGLLSSAERVAWIAIVTHHEFFRIGCSAEVWQIFFFLHVHKLMQRAVAKVNMFRACHRPPALRIILIDLTKYGLA
jgi:hypothetical protein